MHSCKQVQWWPLLLITLGWPQNDEVNIWLPKTHTGSPKMSLWSPAGFLKKSEGQALSLERWNLNNFLFRIHIPVLYNKVPVYRKLKDKDIIMLLYIPADSLDLVILYKGQRINFDVDNWLYKDLRKALSMSIKGESLHLQKHLLFWNRIRSLKVWFDWL